MFRYQGRKLLEEGDSPYKLGQRSKGDPFPQYWHKLAPLGIPGVGLTIIGPLTINPCPVTITGDCTSALKVQNAAATRTVLDVDTVANLVWLNVNASSGQVNVGTTAPGPAGTGFYYGNQNAFQIKGSGGGAPLMHFTPGLEQGLFGSDTTTSTQDFVFETSAKFAGGVAVKVITTPASLVVSADAVDTYVGCTTRSGGGATITITLPAIVDAIGGLGAKDGHLMIIKDESGEANFADHKIDITGADGSPLIVDGVSWPTYTIIAPGRTVWLLARYSGFGSTWVGV